MQAGHVDRIGTLDGTHFTGALAQNAVLTEDIALGVLGGLTGRARIRSLLIMSSDNLAWEVWFYGAHDGASPDPNQDHFHGRWTFVAGDGIQLGSAGLFYYYVDGLDIPYRDTDLAAHVGPHVNVPELHLRLVNRSAAGKTAYGSGGHFRLIAGLEATHGGG